MALVDIAQNFPYFANGFALINENTYSFGEDTFGEQEGGEQKPSVHLI